MTYSSRLVPGARAAIGLATHFLPTREVRYRYVDEFMGDLHGQPVGYQLRYVAGVLSQAWTLRAAVLADPGALHEPTSLRGRWRWSRCHVLRRHYYRTYSNDDGSRYRACAVCHEEDPGDWSGGGPDYLAPMSTAFGQLGGGAVG